MADKFASTQNVGNLTKFIQEIPTTGVPNKIGQKELKSLGYKSSNDLSIITVLKSLGILQSNGVPNSEVYQKLRNKNLAPSVLGELIRTTYSDLFMLFPDANAKDADTIKNYFTQNTTSGPATVKNIVSTFQALCGIAKFDSASTIDTANQNTNPVSSPQHHNLLQANPPVAQIPIHSHGNTSQIHFNIQIHIPGEQTVEVYEAIFRNLGKYVLGIKDANQ